MPKRRKKKVSGNWKRCQQQPIQSAIYAKAFQNGTPFGWCWWCCAVLRYVEMTEQSCKSLNCLVRTEVTSFSAQNIWRLLPQCMISPILSPLNKTIPTLLQVFSKFRPWLLLKHNGSTRFLCLFKTQIKFIKSRCENPFLTRKSKFRVVGILNWIEKIAFFKDLL